MDKIVIKGGARLRGEVRVSGAKNAALPILASAILSGGTSTFRNVPELMDIRTMGRLLALLGAKVEPDLPRGHALRIATESAAREPEVEELGRVLNKMGAHVQGAGTSVITIQGVDELQPIEHAILPDRIEAGTFLVAAAITRGDVLVRDCLPEHLDAVIGKLRASGVEVTADGDGIRVRSKGELKPADISTQPFPG